MTDSAPNGPLTVSLEDLPGLSKALPALMIIAGEVAIRAGDKLIFNRFGLNVAQYSLLASASRCPGLSMTELKKSLFMPRSASSVTQIVDDLEAEGLVRRVPSREDRRVNLIEITDAGRQRLQEVDKRYVEVMNEVAGRLSPDGLRTAVDVLRRFIFEVGGELGMEPPGASSASVRN